jgi:hypothetical protein
MVLSPSLFKMRKVFLSFQLGTCPRNCMILSSISLVLSRVICSKMLASDIAILFRIPINEYQVSLRSVWMSIYREGRSISTLNLELITDRTKINSGVGKDEPRRQGGTVVHGDFLLQRRQGAKGHEARKRMSNR